MPLSKEADISGYIPERKGNIGFFCCVFRKIKYFEQKNKGGRKEIGEYWTN